MGDVAPRRHGPVELAAEPMGRLRVQVAEQLGRVVAGQPGDDPVPDRPERGRMERVGRDVRDAIAWRQCTD